MTYSLNNESPRNLNSNIPLQKRLNQLRVDYINSNGKPQVLGTQSQGAGNASKVSSSNRTQLSDSEVVADFLRNKKAANYSRADEMAKALSLVDAKGKPLLKHKDAHFDGTQEYGVKIDWEKIGGLERSQQAEVLKIFSTIKRGQIKDWKVVVFDENKKGIGHCLWCHLNNDSRSLKNLESLRKAVEESRQWKESN